MAKAPPISREQELTLERERIDDKLKHLEEKAGILEAVKKAHEGPSFIYRIFAPQLPAGTPEAKRDYFAFFDEQHDYIRQHVRKAYFSVTDVELRKQMMRLQIDRAKVLRQMCENSIYEKRSELQQARRNADNSADNPSSWISAAVLAVIAVAIGAAIYNLIGAIAGALVGFFWGQAIITAAKQSEARKVKQAEEEVKQAEELVAWAVDYYHEDDLRPDFFTSVEAETGEEDEHARYDSAMANRARVMGPAAG